MAEHQFLTINEMLFMLGLRKVRTRENPGRYDIFDADGNTLLQGACTTTVAALCQKLFNEHKTAAAKPQKETTK